ncbi:amino acid ABC transporter permease [Aminobacter sp. NyZ550]|jgi:general L-amino acid transport system permease protein|uniref:Amino acid ABC transporter permease n=2 Tax=Aminobacter TaxID=31988 RepID=A0AAC8YRP5_AMIAI|nr:MULTISPECIES: amino acid ABC transporter permease [Aminobacter]AMS43152.1 amino acid ABC transporter permease [Aminobacter aminovorans]MBA8905463.1 general L-amino acid transport system permease protein [Aminobacter ciceronei]MBA9019237.1 general L-amino acid transport system permease protein [Aminobacter ciceronei]MBB3706301.1 general L-amino acid transport system permease protein [Aminobacter aminovorans]MRX34127.1 ABC transporter permease subunit [Aminobacter sp. MDW-2]
MATQDIPQDVGGGRASLLYDPKVRGIFFQILVVVALTAFVYWIIGNTIENLKRANIASGFAFLNGRAGFDVSDTLIQFDSDSTYKRALLVGLINTVVVAGAGIVTASILGFLIGIGRLSNNWLIRKICTVYVELFRNIPPLLVIFFWYFGVLSVLPLPKESIELPFGSYLNSRGFYFPKAVWGEGAWLIGVALLLGIAMSWFVARQARQRQMATGATFPVFWTSLALIVGLPLLALVATGFPVSFDLPQKSTFNLTGGLQIKPEFLSLYLALSFYTAAFIAEIVRAGIRGVNKGQTEASSALGLRSGQALRLVVVPQAMRIVIPPLTSQFLNLTKNSSLAIAIGYPDLVAVGGTVLNQTGQAIEIVVIWMVVYLGLSLITSAFMNWFNAKMALVER